jgi:hypothetical protein
VISAAPPDPSSDPPGNAATVSTVPLDHVRRPQPPWRVADVTECGLPGDLHRTLSRDQIAAKLAKLGTQRTAMTTCMTCLSTARRWPTFEADPVEAIGRETCRPGAGNTGLRDELLAIAALVERQPREFADLLAGIRQHGSPLRAPNSATGFDGSPASPVTTSADARRRCR